MTNRDRLPDKRRVTCSLRGMLVIVGLFALVFAFWEMLWPLYLMAAGPLCGALIERARGGEGITGGILGGLVSYSGFVTLPYIRMWYLGYVGADAFVFFLVILWTAASFGAFVGFAIGCIVGGVADLMHGISTRQNHVVEPVGNGNGNGNMFARELPSMMPED